MNGISMLLQVTGYKLQVTSCKAQAKPVNCISLRLETCYLFHFGNR